ncbi:MAG TPA: ATP-binding protein [Burkholderiaceae bacterium]
MSLAVNPPTDLDLTACDREPIRVPGSIQPHGWFLAVDRASQTVVQVSDNLQVHIGRDPEQTLGAALADVLGAQSLAEVTAALRAHPAGERPIFLCNIELNSRHFDVLVRLDGALTIYEFEAAARPSGDHFRRLYPLIGGFLGQLTDAGSVAAMCDVAVRELRELTGYGRVLAYRFDEDGHGHVLAESREPSYQSYIHHRFPAADIPRQARDLYIANPSRLIADARYTPSRLLPAAHPVSGGNVDLTHSPLRSVSPVHLAYLQNMGTLASMSVSIIVRGKLWGLISCHNYEPQMVAFEVRECCERLGQILALRIESSEDAHEYNLRLELRRRQVLMLAALSQGDSLIDSMEAMEHELLLFAGASGAALLHEGVLARFGQAPSESAVRDLVNWLAVNTDQDVYHTDSLRGIYRGGDAIRDCASGILAISISRVHRHYLIWFRPEFVETIDWAGNPHLKADPDGFLHPRKSFDTWRESVTAHSQPWQAAQVEIATEFRSALLGLVLERAEQMAGLAEELWRANKELEAFSYSVSHDLRAPMRHIVGFTDLLIEFDGAKLNARSLRYLNNIKDSARFAGRLVDDLLSFSQMGRAALHPEQVELGALVADAIDKLRSDAGERAIEWRVAPLPAIEADPVFLHLALYNLLSNAVKYTRPRAQAVIEVSAEQDEQETRLHIRDNGVGFSMDYVQKLFGVFQRLHRMEEFEGTGIGLANVRRIVERHGGRVWAEAELDKGACFSIALPRYISIEGEDKHAKAHFAG